MNTRERALTALRHDQPDKVPWALEFTESALAKVAEYYGDSRLNDVEFFDDWVGNHFWYVEQEIAR